MPEHYLLNTVLLAVAVYVVTMTVATVSGHGPAATAGSIAACVLVAFYWLQCSA